MHKYVYLFTEGNAEMKNLLGGKGANLAEMLRLGLPVPQGITVTTEAFRKYRTDNVICNEIREQIIMKISELEAITCKALGDPQKPLILSVRSGARVSMPGMMDTLLNLGLNDDVVEGLIKITDDPIFVYDSYRRLIQTFGSVVMGIEKNKFELILSKIKKENSVESNSEISIKSLQQVIMLYKELCVIEKGIEFPQQPITQIVAAVKAVFNSWDNPRAKEYRRINSICDDWGTAVNIQEMVFGNRGTDSGSGVVFSRNPCTGEKKFFGEFLINAQGEDVVDGISFPMPIERLKEINSDIFKQLTEIVEMLEKHYKDMQDVEFTIEKNRLFILQTRSGKRTVTATLKILEDLVSEGLIDKEEAVARVEAKQLKVIVSSNVL